MAPRPTYPAPHLQLGQLMVEGRRRGLSFEAWWREAVRPGQPVVMVNHPDPPEGAVRWPTDWNDRDTWRAAILASEQGWRRAFERAVPTAAEAALRFLAPGLEALDEVARERGRDELPAGDELAAA